MLAIVRVVVLDGGRAEMLRDGRWLVQPGVKLELSVTSVSCCAGRGRGVGGLTIAWERATRTDETETATGTPGP